MTAKPTTSDQNRARAKLELRKRERYRVGVGDFVPVATPTYSRPNHLEPFLEVLERIKAGESVRACISVAPRHGKTDLFSHFATQMLLGIPATRTIYASHGAERAIEVGQATLRLSDRMGVDIDPDNRTKKNWKTRAGGGFRSVGIDGPVLGAGADVFAIDDPIKSRVEAESRVIRDKVWGWIQNVALSRLQPNGSMILFHQRWHPDDPIGRAIKLGWEEITLPVVDGQGRALWPDMWNEERLRARRAEVGEYAWHSQYMGQPRGRTDQLFGPAYTYKTLPGEGLVWGAGADLAYSTRTSADFTVFTVFARLGSDPETSKFYIVDMWREQMETTTTKVRLGEFRTRWPAAGAPLFLGSGTEKGAGALLALEWRAAVADKFTRAQPFAAAWNAGRVLVPEHAPWLDDFLSELVSFTGAGDAHDDQVDACVGAFERLNEAPRRPFVFV